MFLNRIISSIPIICCSVLFLVSCTSTTMQVVTSPYAETPDTRNAESSFLLLHYATLQKDQVNIAKYGTKFISQEKEYDHDIAIEALNTLIETGQMDQIAEVSSIILQKFPKNPAASFAQALLAIKAKDYNGAIAYMDNIDAFPYATALRPLIQAWAYTGLNDITSAHLKIHELDHLKDFKDLALKNKTLMDTYFKSKNIVEGLSFTSLDTPVTLPKYFARPLADHFYRLDNKEEAFILLNKALPYDNDGIVARHKSALTAKQITTPVFDAQYGVSLFFLDFTLSVMSTYTNLSPLMVSFLHWAHYISPESYEVLLALTQTLYTQNRLREAIYYSQKIPSYAPEYDMAMLTKGKALSLMKQGNEAEKILAAIYEKYQTYPSILKQVSFAYNMNKDYEKTIEVINKTILSIPAEDEILWALYYLRSVNYFSLNQIENAEQDAIKALTLKGDSPTLLNHLGYIWTIIPKNLDKAFTLLERAYKASPNSYEIVDTLGWNSYMREDYDQALFYLKKANSLNPKSVTIKDHLGDTLWRLGRIREAYYQWKNILNLDIDQDLRISIIHKLKHGLKN